MTETLEVVPRRWKVIQTVREKFTWRHCEKISQPPAPFHPTPRGRAGPNLLATIVFEKYGQHQPLNRQRDRYAREGVDLSLSTLADQVGACTATTRRCRFWPARAPPRKAHRDYRGRLILIVARQDVRQSTSIVDVVLRECYRRMAL